MLAKSVHVFHLDGICKIVSLHSRPAPDCSKTNHPQAPITPVAALSLVALLIVQLVQCRVVDDSWNIAL